MSYDEAMDIIATVVLAAMSELVTTDLEKAQILHEAWRVVSHQRAG